MKNQSPVKFKSESKFIHFWDSIVLLLSFIYCVETPFMLVFNIAPGPKYLFYDIFVGTIYLCDIFVRFQTAKFIDGKWVDSPHEISQNYKQSGFFRDLMTVVPFEVIVTVLGGPVLLGHIFSLVRLVRLKLLVELTNRLQNSPKFNPAFIKIASLAFWVLLSAHWIACGWIALGGFNEKYSITENYIRAFYWCITTLATVGYGDITPQTLHQMIYTVCVMILGAGMYGLIIGNISSILAKKDSAKLHFQEKVDKINSFMRYRKIPTSLQLRVNGYYRYLWESRMGYDETEVLADLPTNIKEDIVLHLNQNIIERVAFLKDAEPTLIRDLVAQLKPVVFTPGDCVFKAGEQGHCMYFILSGKVEVTSRDGKKVFATLGEGNYFGEIALLLSQPRSASIRAIEYCDMYLLERDSFEHVLTYYPKFAEHIHELAAERASQHKTSAA